MTSGDPVNKTFQIRKFFKTLLWVFSAWGIVNFLLIHIKQSPCYYFCFVLTFGPSNIFMILGHIHSLSENLFFKYSFNSRI